MFVEGMRAFQADDFLAKPFNPDLLLALVEARLRTSGGGERGTASEPEPFESDENLQWETRRYAYDDAMPRLLRYRIADALNELGTLGRTSESVVREILLSDTPPGSYSALAHRISTPSHVIKYAWRKEVMPKILVSVKELLVWARRMRTAELISGGVRPLEAAVVLHVDESTIYRDLRWHSSLAESRQGEDRYTGQTDC
jgi:hypothetical protein